jgi:hypothetical protein
LRASVALSSGTDRLRRSKRILVMKRTARNSQRVLGRSAFRNLAVSMGFAGATLLALGAFAQAQKPDTPAAVGGGAMARVLPPAEKIKVLEDELAKEVDKRVKLEEETARRTTENNELVATAKISAKERAALEARLTETRERESQLQKANDRLRVENERIAVTVRLSLPIVAGVAIGILGMLIYTFLFLRKIAARVHGIRTLAEMHELEARLAHASDQVNAEVKRNQTLRHKLADLGITD